MCTLGGVDGTMTSNQRYHLLHVLCFCFTISSGPTGDPSRDVDISLREHGSILYLGMAKEIFMVMYHALG